MTDVGRRPVLEELLTILAAVVLIEADTDALNPKAQTFRVVLTFARDRLTSVPDWCEGQPKPSWLIEEIQQHLAQWQRQKTREAQWVSKEEHLGSSIDTLMVHYTEELKKAQKAAPQNVVTRMQARVAADTVLRLKELQERRYFGGVYSQTESRREKARKAWVEDDAEAVNRENAQNRQREQYQYEPKYTYDKGVYDGLDEATRRRAEEIFRAFHGKYTGFFGNERQQNYAKPPPPTSPGKVPWYTVLGVQPRAKEEEINKAYRRLARRYHPDVSKETNAADRMTEINTARDEGLRGL